MAKHLFKPFGKQNKQINQIENATVLGLKCDEVCAQKQHVYGWFVLKFAKLRRPSLSWLQ